MCGLKPFAALLNTTRIRTLAEISNHTEVVLKLILFGISTKQMHAHNDRADMLMFSKYNVYRLQLRLMEISIVLQIFTE